VLVDADGVERFADRNRELSTGDPTRHPEIEIARWAITHLTPADRARSTVYTSGEHCPMCSAAHAWVGLGRIVFAASAAQITEWRAAAGAARPAVAALPISIVAPGLQAEGPVEGLADEVRVLVEREVATRA
jgi:tRNA(Arg) A34 adenosine deaminase TadA